MAASDADQATSDWKRHVPFTERSDNVLKIVEAYRSSSLVTEREGSLELAKEHESNAFRDSLNRTAYTALVDDIRVRSAKLPPTPSSGSSDGLPPLPPWAQGLPPTSLSKDYPDCRAFARGASSTVFVTTTAPPRAVKAVFRHTQQPHSARREISILRALKGRRGVIDMVDAFAISEREAAEDYAWAIVLPYQPLTLDHVLQSATGFLGRHRIRAIFGDVFTGLEACQSYGIIHRDLKPSAILLAGPDGPAVVSDFGTSYLRNAPGDEPWEKKVLDIGTGAYRVPEALFGISWYDEAIDWWAAGVILAEACRSPPRPIFHSPPTAEDGSQLALILSMIQTTGTPVPETFPSAIDDRVVAKPWTLWTVFPGRPWTEELLPDIDEDLRDLVSKLVVYEPRARMPPSQARLHSAMSSDRSPELKGDQ